MAQRYCLTFAKAPGYPTPAPTARQPLQLSQQPRDSRILGKSSVSLCHSGKCSQERPNAVTPSAWCCRQTRCRPASINLLNSILKPILTSPAPFSSACCSQGWVVIGLPEGESGQCIYREERHRNSRAPSHNSLENERGALSQCSFPYRDHGALPKADMQEPCLHTSLE